MIITRTPFRISFAGGGTDLPEYFNNYREYLRNNTFNSLLKGVIKSNF